MLEAVRQAHDAEILLKKHGDSAPFSSIWKLDGAISIYIKQTLVLFQTHLQTMVYRNHVL